MWIEELTPEQEALIPSFRDKWIEIAFSIEPIDRGKVGDAVKRLYKLIKIQEPNIYFSRSPDDALNMFIRQIQLPSQELNHSLPWESLRQQITEIYGNPLSMELRYELLQTLYNRINQQVKDELMSQIDEDLYDRRAGDIFIGIFKFEPMHLLSQQLYSNLINQMRKKLSIFKFLPDYFIQREYWIEETKCLDFFISALHCDIEPERWEVLNSILTECGWIYPFDKACFICDRPTEINFNPVRLKVDKKIIVKFSD